MSSLVLLIYPQSYANITRASYRIARIHCSVAPPRLPLRFSVLQREKPLVGVTRGLTSARTAILTPFLPWFIVVSPKHNL